MFGFTDKIVDKTLGSLLAGAAGDIIGRHCEGRRTVDAESYVVSTPAEMLDAILSRLGEYRAPYRELYTDDTEMTIGMAWSLAHTKGQFDGKNLMDMWVAYYTECRGYGPGMRTILELCRDGKVQWDNAAHVTFEQGSLGNGCGMRIAPAGLFFGTDIKSMLDYVERATVMTHSHPIAINGAIWQAMAVNLAMRNESDPNRFLKTILNQLKPEGREEYDLTASRLSKLVNMGDSVTPSMAACNLGNGVKSQDSIPTATYLYLRFNSNLLGAITFANAMGGDTDTIASMAGNIIGARHGMRCVPDQLRDIPFLVETGKNLAGASKDYRRSHESLLRFLR